MNENQEIEVWLSEPQEAVLATRQQLILEMAGQGGGKSQNIGYSSGMLISAFPKARGFIGANTYNQLSQSTLDRVFNTWKTAYGFEEYDKHAAPWGAYVVDKRPPPHFTRYQNLRHYDGTISFWNGQLTFIGSLENYKAHEGKEFTWAHLDETKDTKEKALTDVIFGRLRQPGLYFDKDGNLQWFDFAAPEGWTPWNPLYIHTSPAIDGAEWLLKMFNLSSFEKEIKKKVQRGAKDFFYKEFGNRAICIYSAYHNAHNLSAGYLKNQEENLMNDPAAILKLVHGYPFGQAGGAWLPSFRRDQHVQAVPYLPSLPSVSLTLDFNVVPYMTLLAVQFQVLTRYRDETGRKYDEPRPGLFAIEVTRVRFYKEYCLSGPRNSTEAVCDAWAADHRPGTTSIFYYGDATGLHRIPGLGSLTNFKILETRLYGYLHNESKKVKDPNVNEWKRRDLFNDILRGKYPDIEILIDESCEKLIEDCENVKAGKNGKIKPEVEDPNTKKKYQKWGHTSDAAEYLLSEAFKYLLEQR
jgi:hypothetical protein